MSEITFFGVTNFRNTDKKFGIKLDDRRRHFYSVGKTGMGKTEMLKNMAIQDIQGGNGMGFIDPHGEAAEELLHFVPSLRVNDVIYFNPADTDYPIAFNVMEKVDPEHRHLVASGLMSVFKKVWPDVWSARMEYILNNAILALLEYPGSTLLGINRMLSDVDYRAKVIEKISDPVVKAFWTQEYARYTQRYEVEATAAIQNKVGQFISNPLIRNIVGQTKSSIDMREVMDGQKILILNLAKGRIGEDNSRLLGAMLVTKLQLAAMSRVDMPEEDRKDFFLYIDEFQNFASDSFVNILSEARKYRLALILSHQYIAQLGVGTEAKIRDAVFGNVGTIVTFRVGAEDAEWLEKEFTPDFIAEDFVNLGKYNIYIKLMIDGIAGRPFSALTLPPIVFPYENPEDSPKETIIKVSRERYSMPRAFVEDKIATWTETDQPTTPKPAGAQMVSSQTQPQQMLYDARCSSCGKDTKVVFPPDGKRPVYCKSCRNKLKSVKKPAESPQGIQAGPPQSSKAGLGGEAPQQKQAKEISLKEALEKGPTLFYHANRAKQGEGESRKKEMDKEALKKALGKVLSETNKTKKGQLRPGETVYF